MTQTTTTPKINFSIPAMRRWKNLPESVRAEVIYGRLYILCLPKLYHQTISGELFFELMSYGKTTGIGDAYIMNTAVFLNEGSDVVGPDIVFIRKDNVNCMPGEEGLFGPPDLLIEVLSSNKKHDVVIKRSLYEQTGVKEYWTIDPKTKEAVGYCLHNNTYDEPLVLNSKIYIRILDKEITF